MMGAEDDDSEAEAIPETVMEDGEAEPVIADGGEPVVEGEAELPIKFPESPHNDSSASVVRRNTYARLAMLCLCAVRRCYACRYEQAEKERQTRKNAHKPYFETCR
jgi:hypothetical protein